MSEFDRLLEKRAVALQYSPDQDQAPVVVASGMGHMAERITEVAIRAGVPVYEDNSLASLLGQLKLGASIPAELYQAIVDIYIYFLGYGQNRADDGKEADADALQETNEKEK